MNPTLLRMPLVTALILPAALAVAADLPQPSPPAVIPQPAQLRVLRGSFALPGETPIVVHPADGPARVVAEYLAERLRAEAGCTPEVRGFRPQDTLAGLTGAIVITLDPEDRTLGPEAYRLIISSKHVTASASEPRGLFWAVQTLRQIVQSAPPAAPDSDARRQLPAVDIEDHPRYGWRGMLLDCGRRFLPKEFIKRYIDLLAYHKVNVLHWHLTEDQGWRLEIRKYPRLTSVGAWRAATREDEQPRRAGRYGGFYTQQDVREIVAYAESRFVTVVPEIEMPGHCQAALAAYPELSCTGGPFEVSTRWGVHQDVYCAGNERVFTFLQDVLSEVMELFPAPYIHIGGDECPKDRWKACPKCQARIRAEGLADESELQGYFIRRIAKFLESKGRRLIGWDEILEGGLPPNATVQSWRGLRGAVAAARAGHDVICSPTSHCYLDYAQVKAPGEPTRMGFIDLKTAYAFEPTPPELTPEQARHVLGLEANMWTEHAPPERIDWQVFPRLCALAEVGWSPRAARNWQDFRERLKVHLKRLEELGVKYCTAAGP